MFTNTERNIPKETKEVREKEVDEIFLKTNAELIRDYFDFDTTKQEIYLSLDEKKCLAKPVFMPNIGYTMFCIEGVGDFLFDVSHAAEAKPIGFVTETDKKLLLNAEEGLSIVIEKAYKEAEHNW